MGQLDVQNLPGFHVQQIAAQGVQGDHIFAGVNPVRVDHSSGAKGSPLSQNGRGIDQAKGGGKDGSQVDNGLVQVEISLMEAPVVVIHPHQILKAARGPGVVMLFEDGHVDQPISLQGILNHPHFFPDPGITDGYGCPVTVRFRIFHPPPGSFDFLDDAGPDPRPLLGRSEIWLDQSFFIYMRQLESIQHFHFT